MTPDEAMTAIQIRDDARLISLGLITGQAAMMERILRNTFCALVGSKFAAVVAGGQDVAWLIESCRALANAHSELSEQNRQAIKDALIACKAANTKRSDLMHSIIFPGAGTTVQAVKGKRWTHRDTVTPWTLNEIRAVAGELARGHVQLWTAVQDALGRPALSLGDQLRAENP